MSRTLVKIDPANGVDHTTTGGDASRNGVKRGVAPADSAGGPRLLRFPAVRARTGLSRSTIWRLEQTAAFPRHVRLSPNAVGWLEDDVAGWIRQKAGQAPATTSR
jgi:prophage regulatory protein